MVHLGDITKLHGAKIQPVDVITFGSPCQDLSIAGKRAGMAGERSGLFFEAVRIIREMRLNTWGLYPKFAVWENVPGAYSSNKGDDFHAVLESLCQILNSDVSIPRYAGNWPHRGAIVANDYSLAWRTMDAQYWGVPQRRRRITLVLDLTGQRAGEVLFKPESLRRDFTTLIEAWKATARNTPYRTAGYDCMVDTEKRRGDILDYTLKIRSGCNGGGKGALVQTEKSATLSALQDQTLFVPTAFGLCSMHSNSMLSNNPNVTKVVYDARGNGNGKISPTMTGDHNSRVSDFTALCSEYVTYCSSNETFSSSAKELAPTIKARDYKGPPYVDCASSNHWIVRRLTPTECERLQGFPDGWTDIGDWVDSKGKTHKAVNTLRYKALGNSIALPQWYYVLGGIAELLPASATLGSLFDGIGGFPKVWADIHESNKSQCVWASEIEEFSMAVTRKHFPEGS